jgi:hypothetical protein
MSRLLKLAGTAVLAIGFVQMSGGQQAKAGGFSISIGNYGYGTVGRYRSYRPSYGSAYSYGRIYRPTYRSYGGYHHPRRPHYDYHGPTLVPHGNHLDYIPGHYDFHAPGHGIGGYGHHGRH